MLFNSLAFLYFFCIVMAIYYTPVFRGQQVIILTCASFVFYAYHMPILSLLLIATILMIGFFSYNAYHRYTLKTIWVVTGIFLSLFVLSFFKYGFLFYKTFLIYSDFFRETGSIFMSIPLPIGISFFTFEGISLLTDIYRKEKNQKEFENLTISPSLKTHLQNTAIFISFFPHLIAGPIIKAHDFFPQIGLKYFRDIDWEFAFKTLVLGYFFKSVIADNLKDQTFWISYPYFVGQSSYVLIALLFGYSIQIFADFAGYSLIALGLAALLGYRLPINFNFPYIAKSFSEFWQRWHISLSSWLKEYLYIPLGGNRRGMTRMYINIMVVMFLGGLWHGAAWSYAVWGIWHGILLAMERALKNWLKMPANNIFWNIAQMSLVFTFVTIAWLFFKLPDFGQAIWYFKSISNNTHITPNFKIIKYIFLYSAPVVIYHIHYLLKERSAYRRVFNLIEFIIYGVLLLSIMLNSGSANEFIYFQF